MCCRPAAGSTGASEESGVPSCLRCKCLLGSHSLSRRCAGRSPLGQATTTCRARGVCGRPGNWPRGMRGGKLAHVAAAGERRAAESIAPVRVSHPAGFRDRILNSWLAHHLIMFWREGASWRSCQADFIRLPPRFLRTLQRALPPPRALGYPRAPAQPDHRSPSPPRGRSTVRGARPPPCRWGSPHKTQTIFDARSHRPIRQVTTQGHPFDLRAAPAPLPIPQAVGPPTYVPSPLVRTGVIVRRRMLPVRACAAFVQSKELIFLVRTKEAGCLPGCFQSGAPRGAASCLTPSEGMT